MKYITLLFVDLTNAELSVNNTHHNDVKFVNLSRKWQLRRRIIIRTSLSISALVSIYLIYKVTKRFTASQYELISQQNVRAHNRQAIHLQTLLVLIEAKTKDIQNMIDHLKDTATKEQYEAVTNSHERQAVVDSLNTYLKLTTELNTIHNHIQDNTTLPGTQATQALIISLQEQIDKYDQDTEENKITSLYELIQKVCNDIEAEKQAKIQKEEEAAQKRAEEAKKAATPKARWFSWFWGSTSSAESPKSIQGSPSSSPTKSK